MLMYTLVIINSETQAPLEGVKVTADGFVTYTDEKGIARIPLDDDAKDELIKENQERRADGMVERIMKNLVDEMDTVKNIAISSSSKITAGISKHVGEGAKNTINYFGDRIKDVGEKVLKFTKSGLNASGRFVRKVGRWAKTLPTEVMQFGIKANQRARHFAERMRDKFKTAKDTIVKTAGSLERKVTNIVSRGAREVKRRTSKVFSVARNQAKRVISSASRKLVNAAKVVPKVVGPSIEKGFRTLGKMFKEGIKTVGRGIESLAREFTRAGARSDKTQRRTNRQVRRDEKKTGNVVKRTAERVVNAAKRFVKGIFKRK